MVKLDHANWLDRLANWDDPISFGRQVTDCHAALGKFSAMIHHGTGFWRDAWIAARFASFVNADEVRLLHPEPFPDFAVKVDGVELWFEATEAMRPERRRGDEFREDLATLDRGEVPIRQDPDENWLTAELAFAILKARSDQKSIKTYAPQCGLVIYLNESDYGTNEQEIKNSFAPATQAAGVVFQSVDVLWKEDFHRVWTAGLMT